MDNAGDRPTPYGNIKTRRALLPNTTQLAPQALSKMLSGEEAFPVDVLGAILKALGCQLTIAPLVAASSCVERTGETEPARMENVA